MLRMLLLHLRMISLLWSLFETSNATGDDAGNDGDATGDNGGDDPATYTREQYRRTLAREVAASRDRIRDEVRAEMQRERDREEQTRRDQELTEQQQYQELAEQRQARITELEGQVATLSTITTERDRALEALQSYLDREREELPDHTLALLDRLDPVDQLAWLAQHGDAVRPAREGIPPSRTGDTGDAGDRNVAVSYIDRTYRQPQSAASS